MCRFRLAYNYLSKFKEAADCYKNALRIEPGNENFQTNLKQVEEKLTTQGSPGPSKEKQNIMFRLIGLFHLNPFCSNARHARVPRRVPWYGPRWL